MRIWKNYLYSEYLLYVRGIKLCEQLKCSLERIAALQTNKEVAKFDKYSEWEEEVMELSKERNILLIAVLSIDFAYPRPRFSGQISKSA